jgi:UDP-N-acetylglucosamine 2-epimerase (non-hydrolysing)
MQIRVGCIVGTRPEVIKMAPVIKKLDKSTKYMPVVISTGQHRELLRESLNIFKIQPDYDLKIMTDNQTPSKVISLVMSRLDKLIKKISIDIILVQGDTSTAFAAGLCGFLNGISVGHVEAGLRTNDLLQPWPEEAFRQMLDRISTWNFAPTKISKNNLIRENINKNKIIVTGNTVIDAVKLVQSRLSNLTTIFNKIGINSLNKKFILVTAHRRENHGKDFQEIAKALRTIAISHPEVDLIYPIHPNPNVQIPMRKSLQGSKNIYLIPPLDYLDFLTLMKYCLFLISDSGGVQEEALVFKKPVVLLRNKTERPEGIEAGTTYVTGCNQTKIVKIAKKFICHPPVIGNIYPYGDGNASSKIISFLNKSIISKP